MSVGATCYNIAIFPFHHQHFCSCTRSRSVRISTEVTNSVVYLEATVWHQTNQTVHAATASIVVALAYTEATHFVAICLSGTTFLGLPIELRCGLL